MCRADFSGARCDDLPLEGKRVLFLDHKLVLVRIVDALCNLNYNYRIAARNVSLSSLSRQ